MYPKIYYTYISMAYRFFSSNLLITKAKIWVAYTDKIKVKVIHQQLTPTGNAVEDSPIQGLDIEPRLWHNSLVDT